MFRPVAACWRKCRDRKSTRLNSSHSQISYAVFCLKKKNPAVQRLKKRRRKVRLVGCPQHGVVLALHSPPAPKAIVADSQPRADDLEIPRARPTWIYHRY